MEKEEQIDPVKLREGNISLILDSYNDIFSGFDPRSYKERAMSDDFLLECKKAVFDKKDKIELRLLVPKHKRVYEEEIKIKRRLKEHFHKHAKEKETEIKKIKAGGISWFFGGAIIMTLGAFLLKYEGFLFELLFTISEPAGWFFFWEGLWKIFIEPKEKKRDYDFYKKMSSAGIAFSSY